MTMITFLFLKDTPLTDTISAHNREKTIELSSGERNILSFSQNSAERKLATK